MSPIKTDDPRFTFPADVALLTERRYENPTASGAFIENLLQEDQILSAALAAYGLSSTRIDWSRPDVDWSQFRAAIFRTTWDYFQHFEAFSAWLDRAGGETQLFNPRSQIRWNLDKRYLSALQDAGVSVVPSRCLAPGPSPRLGALMDELGWSEAVIKPVVSAGAWHTHRFDRAGADAVDDTLAEVRARQMMLLQPFQKDIMHHGEVTVVMIDGKPTHAVRKTGKPGDFRVQDDFGGLVHAHIATSEELELAQRAIDTCSPRPLYGRVDIVRLNEGPLAVMEVELVEPELWFRMEPAAAMRLAEALAARLADTPKVS